MKEIEVGKNKTHMALVDDEDYFNMIKYRWHLDKDGYAITSWREQNPKRHVTRKMHRLIMNAKNGQIIDHANRIKLDNRKENLRFCNRSQNSANVNGHPKNTSGFHGVNFFNRPSPKKWRAVIGGRLIGYYFNPKTAAFFYDQEAKKQYGEFAKLNFPIKHKRG